MLSSIVYALVCLILDLVVLRPRKDGALRLELVALRHEVRVLRRRTKRVVWRPTDRLVLAALSRYLPRPAWAVFPVRPKTLLRWHRSSFGGSGRCLAAAIDRDDHPFCASAASSFCASPRRTALGLSAIAGRAG